MVKPTKPQPAAPAESWADDEDEAPAAPAAKGAAPLAKLAAIEKEMQGVVFERVDAIRLALIALICRMHFVLLGPPGTGKSFLVDELVRRFGYDKAASKESDVVAAEERKGPPATYFTDTLHPQMPDAAVLGPLDVPQLGRGRYLRRVAGYLPAVVVAFLDECFKCSDATLNAMLKLLNEREYTQDGIVIRAPLMTVFGASNELPRKGPMDALWDRFLLRLFVDKLQEEANVRTLLSGGTPRKAPVVTLSPAELEQLQAARVGVTIPAPVLDAIIQLKNDIARLGVEVSDRRWTQCMDVVKAHALVEGRTVAQLDDLAPLAHTLWNAPDERRKVSETVLGIACPALKSVLAKLDAAIEQRNLALAASAAFTASGGKDAMQEQATAQAAVRFRRLADELDKLAGVTRDKLGNITATTESNPRIGEVARRMTGLRAEVRKVVAL